MKKKNKNPSPKLAARGSRGERAGTNALGKAAPENSLLGGSGAKLGPLLDLGVAQQAEVG